MSALRSDGAIAGQMTNAFRLEALLAEIRLAIRGLRRRPGFTAAAIATLSLRPLPYPDAEQEGARTCESPVGS